MKMKALVVNAKREPKPGYVFDEFEQRTGIVRNGAMVWKDATYGIQEIDVPEVGPDDVLIKVASCGVCGSDGHVHEKDKDGYINFAWLTRFPLIPGHEFCGEIVEIGKDVDTFKVGDYVTAEEMQYCGYCEECRTYHFNQCNNLLEPGSTIPGAMAEYIKVNKKFVWSINDIVEAYGVEEGLELGALVEPTGIAYNGTIIKSGGIKPGTYGAVYGAGAIGLGCIALMRQAGMAKIFALEVNEERQRMAKEFGADYVFNPVELSKQGIGSREVIMEHTHGWGCDLQIEAAGKPDILYPQMSLSVAAGGAIVNIAHSPKNDAAPVNVAQMIWRNGRVTGSNGHAGDAIFKNVIGLIASRRFDYRKLITGRYTLDEAEQAIIDTQKASGGKNLIKMR